MSAEPAGARAIADGASRRLQARATSASTSPTGPGRIATTAVAPLAEAMAPQDCSVRARSEEAQANALGALETPGAPDATVSGS